MFSIILVLLHILICNLKNGYTQVSLCELNLYKFCKTKNLISLIVFPKLKKSECQISKTITLIFLQHYLTPPIFMKLQISKIIH